MTRSNYVSARDLRLRPLSACLGVALLGANLVPAHAVTAAPAFGPNSQLRATFGYLLQSPDPFGLHASAASRQSLVKQTPAGVPGTRAVVTSCGDDSNAGTLRNLILAANSGDTIDLSTSGCSTITLAQGQIAINASDMTIIGAPAGTTIDAHGASRAIFHAGTGTLSLQQITVTNGSYANSNATALGGGIASAGNLVLINSTVTHCSVSGAEAIGGGVAALLSLSMTNSVISDNTAHAFYTAPTPPGGIARPASTAAVTSVIALAGGAYGGGQATLLNSTISGNEVLSNPHVSGSADVSSIAFGGGLLLGKYHSTSGTDGAAALAVSTITGSTIDSNIANGNNGNVGIPGGSTTVAEGAAGGIFNIAPIALNNSTVSGNQADVIGGAATKYAFTAYNSTITANSAGEVGGVYIGPSAVLTLHSTIIAANTATSTAISADLASTPTTPPAGSHQISAVSSPAAVTVTASNNLVTSHDATIVLPASTITANPQLAPLANNGGPTRTHALGASSPAIDAGDNLLNLSTDQRGAGFARVVGVAPDIGAFEAQVAAPPRVIPTLSVWTLGLLSALLALVGWRRQARAIAPHRPR